MHTMAPNPGQSLGGRLVACLPNRIADKLTDEDKDLIAVSVDLSENQPWRRLHPIDARYSFPWFSGRVYLRIMAGREDRARERAREDAKHGAARILVNIVLIGLGAALFYTLAGLGILTASSVLS